jgi:hypothetical protein
MPLRPHFGSDFIWKGAFFQPNATLLTEIGQVVGRLPVAEALLVWLRVSAMPAWLQREPSSIGKFLLREFRADDVNGLSSGNPRLQGRPRLVSFVHFKGDKPTRPHDDAHGSQFTANLGR